MYLEIRAKPKKVARELDPGKVLQSIDNEVIFVNDNNKRKRMTKAEIHFRQIFAKAIKGDLTAARLVVKMAARYFGPEAEGPSDTQFIVVPEELANQTDDKGSHEHRVQKSSKKRSVQKRPLRSSKGSTKAKPAGDLCWIPVSQGCKRGSPDRSRRSQNHDVALGCFCPPDLNNGA